MESLTTTLSTLGHPTRLAIFRLLMRRYPDSVPAGELSKALGLKPNTLSVNIGQLHDAGLVTRTRQGTSLRYQIDLTGAQGLLDGLFMDCCRGRPDLCLPFSEVARGISQPPLQSPLRVLFLCTGNAARSLIAEALLRDLGQERFIAASAGTHPKATPHPQALKLLREKGHDTAPLHSKDVQAHDASGRFDIVITLCNHAANEECPTTPNATLRTHWGLPDPAQATGSDAVKRSAFENTYTQLKRRLTALTTLSIDPNDLVALQRAIDALARDDAPEPQTV